MSQNNISSKPHFAILDGLRGVASILVVCFHIFEAHATGHLDQIINHGYLAVDFFFLLSGYVIGYAYDDRWSKMTLTDFIKIRLVRLQPMVIIGMIIGAACFYFQDYSIWPSIHQTPYWKTLLVMLIGMTLIPVPISMDIRGWQEMHPLNGPGWSLFFEYIGNLLYAIFIRKFSNALLALLVFVSGIALIHLAVTSPDGDVIGGWSIDARQLRIGITRLAFPFFAGLLMSRTCKLTTIRNAFLWASLLLLLFLVFPRIGGKDQVWINGWYDSLTIILVFPIVVYIGASGRISSTIGNKLAKFFGEISYPLYITHYPIIYIYTGWVFDHKPGYNQTLPFAIITFVSSMLLAWACLKWYDEPARAWLKKKFL